MLYEEIGNGIVRVNSAAVKPEDLEQLGRDYIRSAAAHTGTMDSFLQKLDVLRKLTLEDAFSVWQLITPLHTESLRLQLAIAGDDCSNIPGNTSPIFASIWRLWRFSSTVWTISELLSLEKLYLPHILIPPLFRSISERSGNYCIINSNTNSCESGIEIQMSIGY